jgi:phenylpyruvate tautomerase
MPYIKVQSTILKPESALVEEILKELSAKLAQHLGKSESYVMTAFQPEVAMTFGGTTEPVCYIEVKSVGTMSPAQTQGMSADFCQVIAEKLGVPANRTYIEFADAKGSMWGWNGRTF